MKCFFEKVLFNNEQSGYSIVVYKTDDSDFVPAGAVSKYPPADGKTAFTAVGMRLPMTKGAEIELDGKWTEGKYGLQFAVSSFSVSQPKTTDGIAAYLASDLIKGIGDVTAKAIVDKFGLETLGIIEKEPMRLLEISGITEGKLEKILATYSESTGLRDIVAALSVYGVTPKKAAKIQDTFGAQAVDIVETKPYSLCRIHGFGFKTVDAIALNKGIAANDSGRVQEGLMYALNQSQQLGHMFMHSNTLCADALKLLDPKGTFGVTLTQLETELFQLVQDHRLQEEDGRIYLNKNYKAEVEAAKLAAAMIEPMPVDADVHKLIDEVQKDLGIDLAEKQAAGVAMCLTNRFSIITGGPGTGKTTVIKSLLRSYSKLALETIKAGKPSSGGGVLLTAPTGRASRRLAESTGFLAQTLHSALGVMADSPPDAETKQITADLVVVDESSMVDGVLAWQLLKSLKPSAQLLLVGDYNQLPSVGAGNVFRELIECGEVPVTVLDTVYRQANTSRIHLNAHSILQNTAKLLYGSDFVFDDKADAEQTAERVKETFLREVKEHGLERVQVLSPLRARNACGVDKLNKELQELINPKVTGKPEMIVGYNRFRVGDKVMQMRNKDEVTNGDVGFVKAISKTAGSEPTCDIDFGDGRIISYPVEDMENVDLAYATTIHKSQGSEYDVVIMPMLMGFYVMLQRNLVYTAITRAKKKLIGVGEKKALFMAIHASKITERNTVLGKLIKEIAQG